MGPTGASGWEEEAGLPFPFSVHSIWDWGMYLTAGELAGGPGMTKEAQCEGHRKDKVVGKTQGGYVKDQCLWVEHYRTLK